MLRAGVTPHTRPAMEISEFAKEQGKFDALHIALFKAYWAQGKNLGQTEVLQEVGAQVGLDPQKLAQVLQLKVYAEEVENQVQFARRVGITGIPAFIVDEKYLVMGAQPYEYFQKVMEHVLQERRSDAAPQGPSAAL